MKQYLDIVKNIINHGQLKQPTRTVHGTTTTVNSTIGTFCEIFRHDMSQGFPLLTCRKMPIRSILIELEGFIKGITSKAWYIERGCHYWDYWCNPVAAQEFYQKNYQQDQFELWLVDDPDPPPFESIRKYIQQSVDDLGPIYGYQWRHFDQHYGDIDFHGSEWEYNANGIKKGTDQLQSIVKQLKTNPYDRRMVCSAWNPNQEHLMALPPCHVLWHVTVFNNKLNLVWFQRSVDTILGSGSNIASYATLLLLLAKTANLVPGELVGIWSDAHIYMNQLEQAKILAEREPRELPQLEILTDDIFNWNHTKVKLTNYNPHPKMNFELTI